MAKMNNLSTTTTETLPKSGHVNEVCKEWLVREDGALAYKLQSQEINDFYKGNRFRNAVVREDFPTALQEQIKEKETAEQQVESYRRRLREQEEHDKRVAKEIADKLERDLQEQRLRELRDSERVAQEMQEIYVNLPPVPPPSSRDKNKVQPPPPRPAKSSTLQQQHPNDNHRNHHHHHHHHHHQPQQQQQLNQLSPKQQQPQQQHQSISPQQYQIQLQQHHFTQNDGGYVGLALQATPAQQRQMQLQQQRSPTNSSNINNNNNIKINNNQFVKLSPEKYDQLVGNASGQAVIPNVIAKERQLQEHVDDIELYVDPCDYSGLKEIGLPMQEIKEMSAKLKQEQKDELLARRLQELEVHDGMSLEERDRMLAIEAQDKELAKMLQEREKAKAKRAKEKARLRKSQQQKEPQQPPQLTNGIVALHNGPIQPLPQEHFMTSSSTSSGGSRHNYQQQLSNGPNDIQHYRDNSNGADETLPNAAAAAADDDDIIDLEPYSSPIDIIKHQQRTQNGCLTNGSLTRDIASQQARQASLLREDDIYTLPVDTCRVTAGAQAVQSQTAALRPASMSIASDSVPHNGYSQNSMTRSENYSIHSHDSLNSRLTSTSSTNSKTHIDQQNASPTPPYMPIQGSRRSNSSEDRKKKSKDNKCTHQ